MKRESGSLLVIFFILIPAMGEIIQLGFPKTWGFEFEIKDIIINYISSSIGIGGMLLWLKPLCLKPATDAVRKQSPQQ
jgi:hypothetical protein